MKYVGLMFVVLASAAMALGQGAAPRPGEPARPYQPAVPQAPTMVADGGWGYGGGYGGGTVAGSAMNGMASVISAQGNYNLATSAAAVNMTEAQRNEIQNQQQWTDTYFQMRAANRAARAAEAGPKPTMEQLVRIARQGAPAPITSSQVDPFSGRIDWPNALQAEAFAEGRSQLDELMKIHTNYGGLGYSDQEKARDTIDDMFGTLKSMVREIPPQGYVASRNFLRSLMYAMTKSEME